jgi:hypothetical protein
LKTTVVNIRLENCDFYGARGSILGNPYEIGVDGTREQVITRYRKWFGFLLKSRFFKSELEKLRGKKLGCFCKKPNIEVPCHLDIVAEYLNAGR